MLPVKKPRVSKSSGKKRKVVKGAAAHASVQYEITLGAPTTAAVVELADDDNVIRQRAMAGERVRHSVSDLFLWDLSGA